MRVRSSTLSSVAGRGIRLSRVPRRATPPPPAAARRPPDASRSRTARPRCGCARRARSPTSPHPCQYARLWRERCVSAARPVRDLVPVVAGGGRAGRRPARTCRPADRRRAPAPRRGGSAGRAWCRPRRSARTPRCGRARGAIAVSSDAPPVLERLARRAVDEVQAHVETGTRARRRRRCATFAGSCVRSSAASTCGTADCMPIDMRVTPAAASSVDDGIRHGVGVRLDRDLRAGGDAERLRGRPRACARGRPAAAASGVPPPKKTVRRGTDAAGGREHVARRGRPRAGACRRTGPGARRAARRTCTC